jgi:Ca2+-binding RTX toxin-like protein
MTPFTPFLFFSSSHDLILDCSSNVNLFGKNGADFMARGKGTDKVLGGEGTDIFHGDCGTGTTLGCLVN